MNAFRPSFGKSIRLGSVAALTALALLTPGLAAQDDEAESHPAHIHSGSCADLGDVVYSLTDITPIGGGTERSGAASAIPVEGSTTVVDTPLQDLIDGDFAIIMGSETLVPVSSAPAAGLTAGRKVVRRFTNVWKREAGAWRLYWRHANVIATP